MRVRITGVVQGVGFRYETRDRARSLRVAGWVRNEPDGAVEAVFEGDPERVDSMVDWCRRGPPGAHVKRIDVEEERVVGDSSFRVR